LAAQFAYSQAASREDVTMPILFAYLLMVGLFVGGGYGTLYWLTTQEPVKTATAHHPRPTPVTPSVAQAPVANSEPRGSDTAATSDADAEKHPAPESGNHVADNDAPAIAAKADTAGTPPTADIASQSGVPHPARTVAAVADPSPAPDAAQKTPAQKPVAAATPEQAMPPVNAPAKPQRNRIASHARHDRLEAMTLRTVEFPDGSRRSFLIPSARRQRTLAYDPYD
jgi:hypothetical protein